MNEITIAQETPLLSAIVRAASDDSVDVSKMRELLNMQKELEAQQAQRAFTAALHGFQSECPQITRSGGIVVNGQLRSRYSPLEDTMLVIRPYLQKFGFSVTFDTQVDDKGTICAVHCTLSHTAGHSVTSTFPVMPDSSGSKNSIQSIGSALSYGKRYSLGAVLGLVFSNEDDDGRATSMLEESRAAVAIKESPKKQAKPATIVDVPADSADRDVWIATIADMKEARDVTDEALTVALNTAMKTSLKSWTEASDSALKRLSTEDGFNKLTK